MTYTRSKPAMRLFPIYLSVFVTALGIGLVSPLVPRLIEEAGANELLVGLTASVMFASFVLTAWPLGAAIDRWGIRPFLLGGLACYGLAMALMPWTTKLGYFFLLRLLEGIGWAGVWVSTETYVSWVSTSDRRGRNMALYSIALAMGTSSGPVIGSELFLIREGLPFLLTVLLVLIAIALVATVVPEPEHDQEMHAHHPPISLTLAPKLALPLIIAGLYGYGVASLVSLLPVSRPSTQEVSLLMTTTIIASVLAQLPVGHLTDRYGRRPVLVGSLSLLTLSAILASLEPQFDLLLLLAVMLGALAGTLYPIGLAMLADRASSRQLGMANGLFSLSYGVGSIIGPACSGWAMGMFGPYALFSSLGLLSACLLIALILGLDSEAHKSRAQADI
ncbi:MAG: MFS transporter [Herpetosiphonaceae bacterium]|nr:MAG: MFS transporter [Herpetosiphonaceae bacterium]